MVMKVVLTNLTDANLKVWLRILPREGKHLNWTTGAALRKVYLGKGSTTIAMTIAKTDPLKPFFESASDLDVQLTVIQRKTTEERRVAYSVPNTFGNQMGESSDNEFEQEDRDDEAAYQQFQSMGYNDGYSPEYAPMESPQDRKQGDQESTGALYDCGNDSNQGSDMMSQSSVNGQVECSMCHEKNGLEAFTCEACGNYLKSFDN